MSDNITIEELKEVVFDSPLNKSPDTDGLTTEFYKAFWDLIQEPLLNSLNYSLNNESLSISQKQGIITLIPKEGKDLDYLKNWRPLTLLNQDYKYLTTIIANRFKYLLPKIISTDQNGFVPSRFIGYNIQRILNLIEDSRFNSVNGALINLDFEKAFDCIEWDFIIKALQYFEFPDKLITWIKLIYAEPESCVI